jgi:hypothetical protein
MELAPEPHAQEEGAPRPDSGAGGDGDGDGPDSRAVEPTTSGSALMAEGVPPADAGVDTGRAPETEPEPKPLVRTRLVAAQQRLAFAGLLIDRLVQEVANLHANQDLLERVADALPPTTHGDLIELVRNHDVHGVRALLSDRDALFIVPGDVVLEAAALVDDDGGSKVHLLRDLLGFQTTLDSGGLLQLLAEATANGDVHIVRDIVNHIVSGRPTETAEKFAVPFDTLLLADQLGDSSARIHIHRELERLATHVHGPVPPSG